MIWCDMIWYDMTWYDAMRYDAMWCDAIRYDTISIFTFVAHPTFTDMQFLIQSMPVINNVKIKLNRFLVTVKAYTQLLLWAWYCAQLMQFATFTLRFLWTQDDWILFHYQGPFLLTWFNFNLIHYKEWDEITYPWIRTFNPHFTGHLITYSWWD